MRIGVSLTSGLTAPDARTGARWLVERARAADLAELDSLSLGDHHATAGRYWQNTPLLGRLLAEWGERPVGCLFLLPMWNPVLAAEHIGTLASLTDAPFIVQTGIGSGAAEFAAMGAGAARGRRGAVLEDHIATVRALLAGETVAVPPGSTPADAVATVSIGLRPHQQVEWWIGAGGSSAALERAGRLGDAWYAGPDLTLADASRRLDVYRESCAAHGREPRPILRRDLVVLRDDAAAVALGEDVLAAGYRGLDRDAVLFGGPERVAEALGEWRDLGFTDVIARCMTIPQPQAIETLESLAEVRTLLAST